MALLNAAFPAEPRRQLLQTEPCDPAQKRRFCTGAVQWRAGVPSDKFRHRIRQKVPDRRVSAVGDVDRMPDETDSMGTSQY